MSLEANRTAFIADQLYELVAMPLLGLDFTITLKPGPTGLQLTADSLDDDDRSS
ncbi:hypothetical protein [Gordonia aichiensis]|uniref:Uncharacterized protein n=1 Tax=Gordonia aichiensis NBRC 108223 TaxID=1220583 RepID=L7KL28_9ACTN|nr:hypothetical protein [Gordonia aichiensis]GAC49570.1 hypothetical protein GOACH_15_00620 [Gordonia aichiensis NBRC 108223]